MHGNRGPQWPCHSQDTFGSVNLCRLFQACRCISIKALPWQPCIQNGHHYSIGKDQKGGFPQRFRVELYNFSLCSYQIYCYGNHGQNSSTVMPTSTTDSLLLYQLRGRTLQQIGIPDAHSSIPGTLGVQNLPNSTNKLDNSTISSPTTLRGPTGSQGVHTLHDVSRPRFLQSADNDCVRLMRR